ncbi:MAG: chemotaxis protein CheB, partial [Bdellovibrionia bacterium]
AHWLETHTGLTLGQQKWAFLQNRLRDRMGDLGAKDLQAYLQILLRDPVEAQRCVERLTTHKTEWFRELVHFQALKPILEQKLRKSERVHLWSAACSTGLEAYSLLFLCLKVGLDPSLIRVLGTDLSERAILEAKEKPSDPDFLAQLERLRSSSPQLVDPSGLVHRALKESLKWRKLNLISDQLPGEFRFDVIFLRNVLIYFSPERRVQVCQKLLNYLKPGGSLVLGLSESIGNSIPELILEGDSIYRFRGGTERVVSQGWSVQIPSSEKKTPSFEVLVVEDSESMRRLLVEVYSQIAGVQVVGAVAGVKEAVLALRKQVPDLISLDLRLKDGTGLDLLKEVKADAELKQRLRKTRCALVTECSLADGNLVFDSLAQGASFYLQKPKSEDWAQFKGAVTGVVHELIQSKSQGGSAQPQTQKKRVPPVDLQAYQFIVIGSSTGGTEVVTRLLQGLPKDSPPILIVQHMTEAFTGLFASRLERESGRPTFEVRESLELKRGHAYLASGDLHLVIEKRGFRFFATPMDGPRVNRFKPSISRLFRSVLDEGISKRTIALILTGMGDDGAREMVELKDRGAITWGQSEETCAVYGMPRMAAELGALQAELSPEEMIDILSETTHG